jgi:hypothetical protein
MTRCTGGLAILATEARTLASEMTGVVALADAASMSGPRVAMSSNARAKLREGM